MKTDIETKPDGTQTIRRVAAILRKLAHGPKEGMSLSEVSDAMDLTRSTAHRMLKCLVDEGLIEQADGSRRYVIGGLTFELGLAATGRQREVMEWRPAVEMLSRETGATAYLIGRRGREAVCLCKSEGSAVVRVIPVEVGQRRPLGVGAGATALLAATTDADAERVLEVVTLQLAEYPAITPDVLRDNIKAARGTGFAESWQLVVDGCYGLGIAIPGRGRSATMALSLAAHTSQATPSNIAEWKKLLVEALNSKIQ
jgi:DNA-binding IclR family transcriptional regulator